ncbi:hypothetical protein JTB14_001478 [Gonioctena quinquepunctata]|nr:hypothetical protein JTB14_001478 [Gonioctena quinquepunctata]
MLYDVDSDPLGFPTWRISDSKLYVYVQFKKIPGLEFHVDWKLVIPKNKRKDILLKCHDDPQAGHPVVFKIFKRVSEHFYWPEMRADISSHAKRCKVCCENKPEQRKPAGLLTPHRVVDRPFQEFPMNLEIGVPGSSGDFTVDQEILARDRSEPLLQLYKEVKSKLLKAAEKE